MKIITQLLIGLIKIYKIFISPIFPSSCRFEPSCSEYAISCLKTYGLIKGLAKSIYRIARCNPWHSHSGYDPVEQKKELK